MKSLRWSVLLGVLLAVVSTTVAVSPAGAAPGYSQRTLKWRSCYESIQQELWPDEEAEDFGGEIRFECTRVRVPLDYETRRGGMISLALIRLPARDSANRIGSLFTNPGGPGGSGVDFILGSGPISFGPEVRDRFDIVGFDPRGIQRSAGARCFRNEDAALAAAPTIPFPLTDAEEAEWLKADANIQAKCEARSPRILSHMSTANVARDLDVLRRAVGDDKLTFAGYSYGTFLGATYANLFPHKVRAMMLDSALDPIAWTTGAEGEQHVPVTARVGSHTGSQDALDEFFRLCDVSGAELCPIAPGSEARWNAVYDALRAEPLEMAFPITDDDGNITGEENLVYGATDFVAETLQILYVGDLVPVIGFLTADLEEILSGEFEPELAESFAEDVVMFRNGHDNSFTDRAGLDFRSRRAPTYVNFIEGFTGVLCADSDNPHDINAWKRTADALEAESRFGAFWTWGSSICNGWAASDNNRYVGPWDAQTSNTILIVNNEFDPSTPLAGAQALDDALANSALLVVDGGRGHIAADSSLCAVFAADEYLLTGETPDSLTCPANFENPFDLLADLAELDEAGDEAEQLPLVNVILADGSEVTAVLIDGPTPELPIALDPETLEPLNVTIEPADVQPITIVGPA